MREDRLFSLRIQKTAFAKTADKDFFSAFAKYAFQEKVGRPDRALLAAWSRAKAQKRLFSMINSQSAGQLLPAFFLKCFIATLREQFFVRSFRYIHKIKVWRTKACPLSLCAPDLSPLERILASNTSCTIIPKELVGGDYAKRDSLSRVRLSPRICWISQTSGDWLRPMSAMRMTVLT